MKFKSIKGTRDILPPESFQWQLVEQSIHEVMRLFNYQEIRTPVFEETALFARGIGETTDIVEKEMYTFTDRSGTSLTLKPEMTASVVRAYIQHNIGEHQQLTKLYYLAPMFRQERPQAGRLRQFHQFGAEILGGNKPEVDAEIITLALFIYDTLGVKNYKLKINSIGCNNCRPIYRHKLINHLRNIYDKLSQENQRRFHKNPMRILDSKDETDRKLIQNAPVMIDYLCSECFEHFKNLQGILSELSVQYEIDAHIVRGLDYYTKTAFEIISNDLGAQDALLGGGRYDMLVEELGGKPTPGVGFAAGIERLLMVMSKQLLFPNDYSTAEVYLVAADETTRRWVYFQTMILRRAGISCELDLLSRSLKSQMRDANRLNVKHVIIAGKNEFEKNLVVVKDMELKTQQTLPASELLGFLKEKLGKK